MDCFNIVGQRKDRVMHEEFAMLSWHIWWARNVVLWKNHSISYDVIMQQALNHLANGILHNFSVDYRIQKLFSCLGHV